MVKQVDEIEINVLESAMCRAHGYYTIRVFSYETSTGIWAAIGAFFGRPQVRYRVVLYLNDDAVAETDVEPNAWDGAKKRVIMQLINYAEYACSGPPERCLYINTES